jgi:hypothetical protein
MKAVRLTQLKKGQFGITTPRFGEFPDLILQTEVEERHQAFARDGLVTLFRSASSFDCTVSSWGTRSEVKRPNPSQMSRL